MGNVTRWYASIEAAKAALESTGNRSDSVLASELESASEYIEELLNRQFIPITETRYYDWPQKKGNSLVLYLDQDLLALTTLTVQAQDASPTEITSADYYLEPVNKPPYRQVEIDLASASSFLSGSATSQRSVSVLGRWAYSEIAKAAGTVVSGLDSGTTATTFVCSDASLIDVGDTLLIGTEALFVSGRATVDTTANLAANLDAENYDVTVTVNDGSLVNAGEVIQIGSEKMLVESVSGNDLTVRRAYDGSTLAAHTGTLDVYAYRTLTVVRGVNGTTAATHADDAAIVKYVPPATIRKLCIAKALSGQQQGQGAYSGQSGVGERSAELNGNSVKMLEEDALSFFTEVSL